MATHVRGRVDKVFDLCIAPGDLVYHAGDRDKTRARPRYLVTAVEGEWCSAHKFASSQLRSKHYQFRSSECYLVPSAVAELGAVASPDDESSDDDIAQPPPDPLVPVPAEIVDVPAPAPAVSGIPPVQPPSLAANRPRLRLVYHDDSMIML